MTREGGGPLESDASAGVAAGRAIAEVAGEPLASDPMSRIEIRIPQLGESSPEGVVVRWIKQAGEHVHRDEPVLEIETDKANIEIASPAAGVLAETRAREGQVVVGGEVAGLVDTDAEAWPARQRSAGSSGTPIELTERVQPSATACLRCGGAMEPADVSRGGVLFAGRAVRLTVCRSCGRIEMFADDPRSF
jgi:pyruvate/2-oxoglutarate dehydrogenase complex dihydrolipoamide acyltransferase (E2) component